MLGVPICKINNFCRPYLGHLYNIPTKFVLCVSENREDSKSNKSDSGEPIKFVFLYLTIKLLTNNNFFVI